MVSLASPGQIVKRHATPLQDVFAAGHSRTAPPVAQFKKRMIGGADALRTKAKPPLKS